MKFPIVAVIVFALVVASSASAAKTQNVKGYTKKDGTRVESHKRTAPDSSRTNNWSTKGNVNPETGKKGTVDPTSPKKK